MNCVDRPCRDPQIDLNRITERVDRTIDQCRRFEALARLVDFWSRHWETNDLRRWLHDKALRREDRDFVIVALALQGTAAAGDALSTYTPDPKDGGAHTLLFQVAKIEWEFRYRHDATISPTSSGRPHPA